MGNKDEGLGLTAKEVADAFGHPLWAEQYPPVLSTKQAANLLQVPESTLYAWSSQGRLKRCARRVGKYLRYFRDRLVLEVLNTGVDDA